MRKLFTIIAAILLIASAFAQAPEKMSYQAVIRDASNILVTNQSIGMRVTILQGSGTGSEVYKEIYDPNPQTNANGLVTIEIGGGIPVTGTFALIDWANGPYYLKTETDLLGGTNYTITGTSQLLSVPYALQAATAGNFAGDLVVDSLTILSGIKIGENTFYESVWTSPYPYGIQTYNMWTDWPNEPLYIQGYNTGTAQGNSNGNHTIINNEGGNVGIGTFYPQHKLDVNGYINTYQSYKINGFNVLSIGSATGAEQNVFVGKYAGYNSLGNGDDTYIGYMAGYSNTISGNNVAIGSGALFSNIQGHFNTAVGSSALASNTGHSNSAFGFYALAFNTTGTLNDAIGHHALEQNTSGSKNTSIGTNSGLLNQTGSGNVCIGFEAGFNNTNSNRLYIANNQTTSLIYGEFDNNILAFNANVGIWTQNPGSELDVHGTLRLSGSTSGYVGLAPAAVAGSTTYTLPTQDGSSGQFLQTDGNATLSWGDAIITGHYIGELYGGGIVVAVWKEAGVEKGLIASLTDVSAGEVWSNVPTLIGPSAQSKTDGLNNTDAIVTQLGCTSGAALVCHNYHAGGYDWYLPAAWELILCYNAAFVVNTILTDADGFQFGFYWSSTEHFSGNYAWGRYFDYSNFEYPNKSSYIGRVRAVRRF